MFVTAATGTSDRLSTRTAPCASRADTRLECGRREQKLALLAAPLSGRTSPARLRSAWCLARGEDDTDGACVVVRLRLGAPASRVVDGAILLPGATQRRRVVLPAPPPSLTVVGKGRVGSALGRMATTAGSSVTFVTRDDGPEAFGAPGPILVATHASDLDAVLAKVPTTRRGDLILLQGGLLREPWLARRHLSGVTQAALYLSARADGSISDGGGATVASGPLASVVPGVLARGGVAARAVERESFARVALEKLLWTSIFWLVCDVRGETVGEVVANPEGVACVRTLARELVRVAARADEFSECARIDEDASECVDDVVDGLVAYSRSIPTAVPNREMAIKETGFRNGWFLRVGGGAKTQPSHADWLARAGVDPEALVAAAKDSE